MLKNKKMLKNDSSQHNARLFHCYKETHNKKSPLQIHFYLRLKTVLLVTRDEAWYISAYLQKRILFGEKTCFCFIYSFEKGLAFLDFSIH